MRAVRRRSAAMVVRPAPCEAIWPLAVAQLEMVRQMPAELDQIVVEKHRPRLERRHHRRAIDLGEDVVLQIEGREEFERTVDRRLAVAAVP
jgi:hypothetical protein